MYSDLGGPGLALTFSTMSSSSLSCLDDNSRFASFFRRTSFRVAFEDDGFGLEAGGVLSLGQVAFHVSSAFYLKWGWHGLHPVQSHLTSSSFSSWPCFVASEELLIQARHRGHCLHLQSLSQDRPTLQMHICFVV